MCLRVLGYSHKLNEKKRLLICATHTIACRQRHCLLSSACASWRIKRVSRQVNRQCTWRHIHEDSVWKGNSRWWNPPSISLFALENMSAQPKLKIVLHFLFILFVVLFLWLFTCFESFFLLLILSLSILFYLVFISYLIFNFLLLILIYYQFHLLSFNLI